MGIVSNIVCKTAGIAGMSYAVYDACKVAKSVSKKSEHKAAADHFEKIYADTKTIDFSSPADNAIQSKIKDLREKNPIIPLKTKIEGYFKGMLMSLGNNIVPIICSSLAICTKGFTSKLGAFGLAAFGVYKLAREGFGVGKQNPMK